MGLFSGLIVFLSGMLIHSPELSMLMTAIHKISACLWLILVLLHVCQYRKKEMLSTGKKYRNTENDKTSQ